MTRRSRALAAFALIIWGSAATAAPQDLKGLSIEQLMQIDVTLATRRPEPVASAPTAISVITGDDIRRSGVTTLADAIANAVNGVINVITRSSRDTQGVFAQIGGGNEDPADAELRYGGRAGAAT